jgi:hypothetical protein
MKAVLMAHSSSPVYQCRKFGMLVGWVVMNARVYIEVCMGRFMVHFTAQRETGSPVNMYVCLSVCLLISSIYLSRYLYICLSVHPFYLYQIFIFWWKKIRWQFFQEFFVKSVVSCEGIKQG